MGKVQKIVLTEGQLTYLKNCFPNEKNAVIAEALGISTRSVVRLAKKHSLHKSEEFTRESINRAVQASIIVMKGKPKPPGFHIPNGEKYQFKKGETHLQRYGQERSEEWRRNNAESRRRTFKLEKARALYGIPRQTKLQVVKRPKKQIQFRYYLRKLGYSIERGSFTAYYDNNTQRSLELEQRPRTGFTFLER